MNGLKTLRQLEFTGDDTVSMNDKAAGQINSLCDNCYRAMNDDFNTALTIGHLFNLLKKINSIHTHNLHPAEIGKETFERMKNTFISFVTDVLGLREEDNLDSEQILNVLIGIYSEAKAAKDYDKVDEIRNQLKSQGVVLKDTKSGIDWAYEE